MSVSASDLRDLPMVEGQLKLEWRVSPPALIEALLGGCQFCCYVAVRTLTRKNFRTFNLSIRDGGVRCCAQGSVTRDSEAIQSVIDALCEADWSVPIEEQMIIFHCEPRHRNVESRSFDKLSVTLPFVKIGGSDGYLDEVEFNPTVITVKGTKDGEFMSMTMFEYPSGSSRPVNEECVLELHALPGKSIFETRIIATLPATY